MTPGVDFATALAALGGDRLLLAEISQVLLAEAPLQLARLQAALALGDLRSAHREAHTLKGSLGCIAAREAQLQAEALEIAARDGALERCGPLYDRLVLAAGEALAAVRSFNSAAS